MRGANRLPGSSHATILWRQRYPSGILWPLPTATAAASSSLATEASSALLLRPRADTGGASIIFALRSLSRRCRSSACHTAKRSASDCFAAALAAAFVAAAAWRFDVDFFSFRSCSLRCSAATLSRSSFSAARTNGSSVAASLSLEDEDELSLRLFLSFFFSFFPLLF